MLKNVRSQPDHSIRTRLVKPQVKMIVFILITLALSAVGLPTAAANDDIMSESQDSSDAPVTTGDSSEFETPEVPSPAVVDAVTNVGTGSELVTTTAGNKTVAIEVVDADQKDRITDPSGVTHVQDVIGDVDLEIDVLETGFAIVAHLASAESPHELRFNVSLPEGAILGLNDDGSVDVIDSDGFSIGTFSVPWASDVNGSDVPTVYSIEGNTIVQTVDLVSEDLYPVFADPEFNWGILSGTIYFSRQETSDICLGGIAALTLMMWAAPLWATSIVGNFIALGLLVVTFESCSIYMMGECLKLKSYPPFSFSYTGGYCS